MKRELIKETIFKLEVRNVDIKIQGKKHFILKKKMIIAAVSVNTENKN